jgi:hypothetical protein
VLIAILVADRRPVDLGRVMDLVSEVEPLEEELVLVHPDRDRSRLAAPGERANGDPAPIMALMKP